MTSGHLVEVSRRALLGNQSSWGSFVASPDFSQYGYCWLRDGAFCAYAAVRSGELAASAPFHEWAATAILAIRPLIDSAIDRHRSGVPLSGADLPPCRFSMDGQVVADDWPNFQIDGYGFWLWALGEHLVASGEAPSAAVLEAVRLVAGYLDELAFVACFDVWEMYPDYVHTSTLAGVAAGLRAAATILRDQSFSDRSIEVIDRLRSLAGSGGRYVKSDGSSEVDASTLWLGAPLDLVAPDDALLRATVAAVEAQLLLEGGVRRFPSDTYFGGGAWPVLTATLGSCHLRAGDRVRAEECLSWIERRIDGNELGEQFGGEHRDPTMFAEWTSNWGPPARQLVWSHAMHLVLAADLGLLPAVLPSAVALPANQMSLPA